ncbi:hypothetical protein [Bacillus sp. CH_203]|uniref:hypothetical protein n=1 Tax=Bacillus sp. CH_203 TaxID=2978216 RepID=UPI0030F56914|nr:hypothetical protein [Bacillus cereus]
MANKKRPVMFIPSNFTVAEKVRVNLKDCNIRMHDGIEMLYANMYKEHFEGDVYYEGWDIYTEDNPIVFLDKIESVILQEERLV